MPRDLRNPGSSVVISVTFAIAFRLLQSFRVLHDPISSDLVVPVLLPVRGVLSLRNISPSLNLDAKRRLLLRKGCLPLAAIYLLRIGKYIPVWY